MEGGICIFYQVMLFPNPEVSDTTEDEQNY
jgi:hypothetical protein